MNILYVVHYFLPAHQAGTEIYTSLLARRFQEDGHRVRVLASEDGPPSGQDVEIKEDRWQDIPVFRLYRHEPRNFAESYTDERIDRAFEGLLDELRPDVVHFQHTFRLSAGMIETAKKHGAAVLVTLADYWFICPPILLLQPRGVLCSGPAPPKCAQCGNAIGVLYSGSAENTTLGKIYESLVRTAHDMKRSLPRPLVERLRFWKQARELSDPDSSYKKRLAMIEQRQKTMKNALASADLVIAPSRFMLEKTVEAGAVERERIVHSDYGFDKTPFQGLKKMPGETVRFGYVGTPVEHKGLHVAVEAMNMASDAPAELLVYGDLSWFPAYARRLRCMSRNPRTRFMGRFEHHDIAEVLAGLDAVIVPSLWYENSPLTMHEAFMAGVPVVASDMGGMKELLENGGGRTFQPGDPADLARVIREIASDPSELEKLAASIPEVKSIEENAEELLHWYQKFSSQQG
ncbi:MAG: glycosyltransferase [bacterium]